MLGDATEKGYSVRAAACKSWEWDDRKDGDQHRCWRELVVLEDQTMMDLAETMDAAKGSERDRADEDTAHC